MILTLKPIRRHFVTGLSKGPQGADGMTTLAREAYLAMLAAPWSDDSREAMMPVHEYDRDPPTGQAYKCVWGYDKVGRTIQSACGAECYTYRIPADALDDQNADGVALVQSVAMRIIGDRSLDQGVCIWCELSPVATPSPLSNAIASFAGTAYLDTQSQLDADGNPITPNKRTGMSASITTDLEDATPELYLHVYLFLADYLSVRGAWIEGGAMFADGDAVVDFSRDVVIAESDSDSGTCALDIGRLPTTTSITPAYALQHLPRVSLWENFTIFCDNSTNGVMDDEHSGGLSSNFDLRVKDILAFLFSAPSLWAHSNMVALSATIAYAQKGLLKFTSSSVGYCCLCSHGLTHGRLFRGLRFQYAIPDTIPYRLLVYGISADLSIPSSASGSSLHFATPLAFWADILSRSFRAGTAKTVRLMTDSGLSKSTMPTATDAETTDAPIQPLASRDVTSQLSRVEFDAPFKSGELSTLIVALIPNGAPSGTADQVSEISATATRNITATIPISATRQRITAAITLSGTVSFGISSTPKQAVQGCYSGLQTITAGGEYGWKDTSISNMSANYVKTNFSVAYLTGLNLTFTHSGKTYTYNTDSGDPVPSFSFKVDFYLWKPPALVSNWGPLQFSYSGRPAGTLSFTAHAPDGSTLPVAATFDGEHLVQFRTAGGASDLRDDPDLAESGFMFDSQYGYISPKDWHTTSAAVTAYAQNYDTQSASIIASARASLSAFAYSFASSANETSVATVIQSGTISFVRDGITYIASYSVSTTPILGVGNKTTGTRIVVGNDSTETGTAYGNVPAISQRMQFAGSDGSVIWAAALLPAAQISGDIAFQAKTAYHGSSQGIGTVFNDGAATGSGAAYRVGLQGTVTIVEAFAESEINPGLITLIE